MTSEFLILTDDQKSRDIALLLDEFAQIALYRKNAFQVLGIPVSASSREINRRQQIAEIASRTGEPLPHGPATYVILGNTHDPSEIGKIARELQDPLRRLLHEFFWLWVNGEDTPPMNLNGIPGLTQQINYWKLRQEADKTGVALHNLAILTHATALEIEHIIAAGEGTSENINQVQHYWEQAYAYWRSVQEHDKFWDLVTARIREIDDPQLTTGMSRRLRASLPGFLISIHTRLYINSMEQNQVSEGQRHLSIINSSNVDLKSIEDTIRLLLEPIRDRVKLFCDTSQTKIETDTVHANETVRLLMAQCSPQLRIINELLPRDSMVRSIVFEEFVNVCLDGIRKFYRKTDDYKTALSLLKQLKDYGRTKKTQEQINAFTNQVIEESEIGNYWHSSGYYQLDQSTLALLEQAHGCCLQGELETAKEILIRLLQKEYPLEGISSSCVSTALAFCLNLIGIQYLEEALQISQLERRSVIRIRNRAQNPTYGFTNTAKAILTDTVELWGLLSVLECMACGRTISDGYYIIRISNTKALICPECQRQDLVEINNRREQIYNKLVYAQNHFYTSIQLNNSNKVPKNNLEFVFEIMRKIDLEIPRSKMIFTLPSVSVQRPSDRKEGKISTSPKNTPNAKPITAVHDRAPTERALHPTNPPQNVNLIKKNKTRSGTPDWVILLIIISLTLSVFALLGIPKRNVPTETETIYVTVPRYVTRVVTNTPAISTPFQSRTTTVVDNSPTVQVIACSTVTLNVRKGPGKEYPVIAGISPNDCVKVSARSFDGSFLRIQMNLNGNLIEGWAASEYLVLGENIGLYDIPIRLYP